MNLGELQKAVKADKDKKNEFGGYSYRTAEGILAAMKAKMPADASVTLSDSIHSIGEQLFLEATVCLSIGGDVHTVTAWAMHPVVKKGMDPAQITGSSSSYARKYALQGLLAIDDGSVDPDATNKHDADTDEDNERGEWLAKMRRRDPWAAALFEDSNYGPTSDPSDRANHLAGGIIASFKRKKTRGELDNEWDRRSKNIEGIKKSFPEIASRIEAEYNTINEAFDLEAV